MEKTHSKIISMEEPWQRMASFMAFSLEQVFFSPQPAQHIGEWDFVGYGSNKHGNSMGCGFNGISPAVTGIFTEERTG